MFLISDSMPSMPALRRLDHFLAGADAVEHAVERGGARVQRRSGEIGGRIVGRAVDRLPVASRFCTRPISLARSVAARSGSCARRPKGRQPWCLPPIARSSAAAISGKLRFFAVELARIRDSIGSNSIDRRQCADLQRLSGRKRKGTLPAHCSAGSGRTTNRRLCRASASVERDQSSRPYSQPGRAVAVARHAVAILADHRLAALDPAAVARFGGGEVFVERRRRHVDHMRVEAAAAIGGDAGSRCSGAEAVQGVGADARSDRAGALIILNASSASAASQAVGENRRDIGFLNSSKTTRVRRRRCARARPLQS